MAKKTEKVTDMTREGAAARAVAEGEGDAMAESSASDVVVEDDDEIFLDDDDEVFLEDDDDVLEDDEDDDFIDLMEDDDSGWLPDPEVVGQERFWDGTEWTDEVRPAEAPVEQTDGVRPGWEPVEETDEVRAVEEPVEETDEVRPVWEPVEEDDEDEDEEVFDSDDDTLDALMEDDGSGWMNDPVVAGQERFWDGTQWTDDVRPVEEEEVVEVRRGRHALPDHVPELQRAMAAATDDIDDVEDRLSSLFERIDEKGRKKRGAEAGAAPGPVSKASSQSRLHEEFGAISRGGADDPMYMGREEAGPAFGAGDDDEAFADLDAALAEEAPDKPSRRRRFFRRRS